MALTLVKFQARYQKGHQWIDYPDMDLKPGRCLGVKGVSGCGKTTLFNALFQPWFAGCFRYERAEILGRDLAGWGKGLFRHVSYLPQYAQNGLNPALTVEEQVRLVLRAMPDRGPAGWKMVGSYLQQLALPERVLGQYAAALSGGMKQRLLLLLGFLKKPALFVLDEPSAALDYQTLWTAAGFLRARKEEGCAIAVTSHHDGFLRLVADETIYLGGSTGAGLVD